jgi:iron complex transport system substrate-binding protein
VHYRPRMRIVSLACSNTEIVAALGCADLLVGVDDHSDFPASAIAPLPRVGPDLEIDIERVAALEPDLVLASLTLPGHETVVEGVEAAGLPHLTLAPTSLDDVYANVALVAERLGVSERGRHLVARMRSELERAPAGQPQDEAPSILVQWWPRPVIAPGRLSWVQQLIAAAGGRNPLEHEDRPSRPLEDEEVAALDPDAIVLSWCGVDPAKYRPDVIYRNPAFSGLAAVRAGRIYCIPEAYLGRPGPRLVEGVRALRQVVAAGRAT